MSMSNRSTIEAVFEVLRKGGLTLDKLIITLLEDPLYQQYPATYSLVHSTVPILQSLLDAQSTCRTVAKWVLDTSQAKYQSQMLHLTSKESGFQFSAANMTEEKLTAFSIDELSSEMQMIAPDLWSLFEILLSADEKLNHRRDHLRKRANPGDHGKSQMAIDGDIDMEDLIPGAPTLDTADSEAYGSANIKLIDEGEDEPEDLQDQLEHQANALITIKKVICLSVMMHSSNRYCNALQSVMGIFLHSCNAPETVMELLAHMGLSIATNTVNTAVTNLSNNAHLAARHLGQEFLAAYAYDNLDIDLKHSVPTVEKPQDTLIHITTGTLLPLYHGVTTADLECSDELWAKHYRNPDAKPEDIPSIPFYDLFKIYPEPPSDASNLTRRERFQAWKYCSDLIEFGPQYFHTFQGTHSKLQPEEIDMIPVVKTQQVPLRAVDTSPSTPAGNVEVLKSFFQQTGVGDPTDDDSHSASPGNHVALVFGDLLTGQHVRSVMESRSIEATPWRRMQFMVFVMGLFHLKMACADAIWRMFIHCKASNTDENGLLAQVHQIRPKETGKISTKPGFRRMHEVIQHVGLVSRLDRWRLAAKAVNPAWNTLETFAESKPTFEMIQQMAYEMVRQDTKEYDELTRKRTHNDADRDHQHENGILQGKIFLLYEEMSYAMNHGDIGRVESLFIPWIFIFLGCGKHKYAIEMRRYLENIHFIYPKALSRAIQMNILCNPSGKKGCFRAVDWLVEHNNLYTKRIYAGKFSNHQKERIINQSPLIEVYKNTRLQFEKMFILDHRTMRHSPPKMKMTFKKLGAYFEKEQANVEVKGRKSAFCIPDAMAIGAHIAMTEEMDKENGDDNDADDMEAVEDDGSIDL